MITIYLNSLYNLLCQNNPFRLIGVQLWKNIKALRNLRRNMHRAQKRIGQLQHRLQSVEAFVEHPHLQPKQRFDVYR